MAAGARDPLDEHHIGGVLEDRAVPLPQNVPQILRGAPARRIVLAHITEPSGKFGQPLPVGRFALPLDWEMRGLEKLGPGDEGDAGGADYFHGSWESGARSRELGRRMQSYTSRLKF